VLDASEDPSLQPLVRRGLIAKRPKQLIRMQGEVGMVMSRAALRLIAPRLLNETDDDEGCPFLGSEDATIGYCAQKLGVAMVHNPLDVPNIEMARISAAVQPERDKDQLCRSVEEGCFVSLVCPPNKVLKAVTTAAWGRVKVDCDGSRLLPNNWTAGVVNIDVDDCLEPPRGECRLAATWTLPT